MNPHFSHDEFPVTTSDGRTFHLCEAVTFFRRDGSIIIMPLGTDSDAPAIWPEIPPFGKYWRAAFLHDAACRLKTRPIIGTKKECDELFLEAMGACGVSAAEALIIYEGVARFGWHAFLEDRTMTGPTRTVPA